MNKLQFFEVAQLLHQVDQFYNERMQRRGAYYDPTNGTGFVLYHQFGENGKTELRKILYAILTTAPCSGLSHDVTRSDLLQIIEEEWVDDALERLNAMKAAYKQHYEKTEPI